MICTPKMLLARWTTRSLALVMLLAAASTAAANACDALVAALGDRVVNVTCFASADLTTANPDTTPADNSIAGLPPFAYTPSSDAVSLSPEPPFDTPITRQVPGLQIAGGMADDPHALWVLRLPADWNGRLVLGVPGGTSSEYSLDKLVSDFVVQQGYAYASTNKGILNFFFTTADDPLAIQWGPPQPVGPTTNLYFHFYLNERENSYEEWFRRAAETAKLAQQAARTHYGSAPLRTYCTGISNGGWVVHRLMAKQAPNICDGGAAWEPIYWAAEGPNFLTHLPPFVRDMVDYTASGFDPASAAYQAIVAEGYPPDIAATSPTFFDPNLSYWEWYNNRINHLASDFFALKLDPAYTGTVADYDYAARLVAEPGLLARVKRIATPGACPGRNPLIDIAGTMDALAPIKLHARVFRQEMVDAGCADLHRLYEVQNGNHFDNAKQSAGNFPQLEFIQPHYHDAFERLVRWVENGEAAPAGQCIARGGAIGAGPRPEHCAQLLVP